MLRSKKKKPPPHVGNCQCRHCAKKRKRGLIPPLPDPRQLGLFALGLVLVLVGCATMKVRRACRVECEDKRGPVMSWYGGPTIPPDAWDDCMGACEAREEGDEDGEAAAVR